MKPSAAAVQPRRNDRQPGASAHSRAAWFRFWLKVSRPGLWSTAAWFYLVRWKSRPPLDLVNQIGYLLVFLLSSWLNDLPQLPWATFLFGALFAMHAHLFGQIMDILPDREAGRRTTATLLGVRASKLLLVLFLVAESALVAVLFKNAAIGAFLGLAAVWFLLDVGLIWKERLYTQGQIRLFAFGLNGVALGSMPWMWATGSLTRLP